MFLRNGAWELLAARPLTPALSPEAGEWEKESGPFFLPLPRFGGEGRGEGAKRLTSPKQRSGRNKQVCPRTPKGIQADKGGRTRNNPRPSHHLSLSAIAERRHESNNSIIANADAAYFFAFKSFFNNSSASSVVILDSTTTLATIPSKHRPGCSTLA